MFLINAGATLLSVIPTSVWFWAYYEFSKQFFETSDPEKKRNLRRVELIAWQGVTISNFLALLAWIVVLNEFGAKKESTVQAEKIKALRAEEAPLTASLEENIVFTESVSKSILNTFKESSLNNDDPDEEGQITFYENSERFTDLHIVDAEEDDLDSAIWS